MAEETVLKFLEEHNRPFSVADIQTSVKLTKTAVQKALDSLVNRGKVKLKEYGKSKVYHFMQVNSTGDTKEVLLEMDRKINDVSLNLQELNEKLKKNSSKLREISGKIPLNDAIDKKIQLERELVDVKKKLEQYKGTEVVDPEYKKKIVKNYEKNLECYKKRKRMCVDILNAILENYPKSKKHLYEDIGIETDENAQFTVESFK